MTTYRQAEEHIRQLNTELEQRVKDRTEQLRSLSAHLQSAREAERTRIAREIHDELGQSLTALKMDLSWLDRRLSKNQNDLSDKITSMTDLVDHTIRTVQRISSELRPGLLDDLGLTAAIEWQAEVFQDRTGIGCNTVFHPEELVLDRHRSTEIFRIFQETLTNIVRHAEASQVDVSLTKNNGQVTLMIQDNGKGITETQLADRNAFGLMGMRERAISLGGTISFSGQSNAGTTVEVNIPLDGETQQ